MADSFANDKIASIRARQILVPLESPVWLGAAVVTAREYCLVEFSTESGQSGTSLAFTRGMNLAGIVADLIAPQLLGEPAADTERLWEKLYSATRLNGRQGAILRAISLADIALWDWKARSFGSPLSTVLGGMRHSVPVMMAGGYYRDGKGVEELCDEFHGYVDEGYRRLKLIIGGASLEEDLRRFTAVRKSLPDHIPLGADANGAWTDPKAAWRWVESANTVGPGLAFIEEPLPPENREGLAWLTDHATVPVAVGEFLAGRWTFQEYLTRGALNIVRADATLCGGISEWKRIAALANAFNCPLMPHYFASLHLHLALALPGSECIEVVSTRDRNSSFQLIAGQSYAFENGEATSLGRPGLGLEVDEDFVSAHTTGDLHRTYQK